MIATDRSVAKATHAAIWVKGGAVQGWSLNQKRNSPLICNPKTEASFHAEIALLRRYQVKGGTVYVARASGGLSRPCGPCAAALEATGARIVWAP